MDTQVTWRKSTRSGGDGGNCVELSSTGDVRDSKNQAGPVLRADLASLVTVVKTGRLDLS